MHSDNKVFTFTDEDDRGRLSKVYTTYVSGLKKEEFKAYPSSGIGSTCLKYTYHYIGQEEVGRAASLEHWTIEMENATLGVTFNSKSVFFDGIDNYIDCGNTVGAYDTTDTFSISFWIKPDSLGGTSFLFNREGDNDDGYWIRQTANNEIRIDSRNSGNVNRIFSQQLMIDDVWNHVVITYDGSDDMSGFEVYVGGIKNDTPSAGGMNGAWLDVNSIFEIGRRDTGVSYFLGKLDELSFWDKALDQTEVDLIFNEGVPTDISSVPSYAINCTNFYRMGDDDVFPTIKDVKGTADGTMVNMVAEDINDDIQE